ncbi:FMN-binding protein [Clavibacter californiensis]|uniref:FMN-binding protein n=1 Tax=Clavibacter californiensis TaxID=1401995 RepID=A0ABX9N189_9MICO|nr:FMN-binding protein [Clavibacter californiensis]RII87581.1 FMN-binding protein [Clavibacter californiensis]UKF80579.1 FMN-binding protein [Clavibacter californiensis]
MRARAAAASVLASTAVLVAGWQIGTVGVTTTPPASDAAAASSAGTSSTATPSTGATPSTTVPATTAAGGTFTGASASTRYGQVQVRITVADGRITDVTALRLTDHDGRSVAISNRAAPILRQEVLAAQSADVQSVSGATYTSEGYLTSLQSAVDQAGL